jgi:hypothetical protein
VDAEANFQKYLDHPGVVWNCPLTPLAHLGLGRAYAQPGDTAKARAAYHDFLTLWKDADPAPHPERSQGRVREAAMNSWDAGIISLHGWRASKTMLMR